MRRIEHEHNTECDNPGNNIIRINNAAVNYEPAGCRRQLVGSFREAAIRRHDHYCDEP